MSGQIFLDGQQNLAALSVPGVYGDIILPTPFLLGTPTNIEGLVGVASWGPVDALIPASALTDAALSMGPPQIRDYDIVSHIAAATQVGGAIGFQCVRVTDGTDTAASVAIGTGGVYSSATATFSANPAANDTLTLNGTL
jgi:Bacteriophage tail sheath protein